MITHRIGVVTSTRADYGILFWILKSVCEDDRLELLLYVTGTHLLDGFGSTITQIEADGFTIQRQIPIFPNNDNEGTLTDVAASALSNFGRALLEDNPSILILLGDRFEIPPIACAAVLNGVPIAHIHGGEQSLGSIDEYFRHAITKLSTLHFAATETYRRRIIQMGEVDNRVHDFGSPALDHLHRTSLYDRKDLEDDLRISLDRPTALVTYHPVTTEPGQSENQVSEMIEAILEQDGLQAIITKANADAEGELINTILAAACRTHPSRLHLYDSLGTRRYLSCIKHVHLMIGNSSSGLIEAPSFACPVVNVGSRQDGRVMARNVIQVGNSRIEIREGIQQAMSEVFSSSIRGMTNPYDHFGDGDVSNRIVGEIKKFCAQPPYRRKPFIDLTFSIPND